MHFVFASMRRNFTGSAVTVTEESLKEATPFYSN